MTDICTAGSAEDNPFHVLGPLAPEPPLVDNDNDHSGWWQDALNLPNSLTAEQIAFWGLRNRARRAENLKKTKKTNSLIALEHIFEETVLSTSAEDASQGQGFVKTEERSWSGEALGFPADIPKSNSEPQAGVDDDDDDSRSAIDNHDYYGSDVEDDRPKLGEKKLKVSKARIRCTQTPDPELQPPSPQTPCVAKPSNQGVGYKHPNFVEKINGEMDPSYVEISWDLFMSIFLPGDKQIPPATLRRLISFEGLDKAAKSSEPEMYPILVSI